MRGDFDKEIFLSNITELLKAKEMRIGELETEVGVSLGYISRINKESNAKPSLDFVMKVAKFFSVSLTTLLETDLRNFTSQEQYLLIFLQKLQDDTANWKVSWETETAEYLNERLEVDADGKCKHPLFESVSFSERTEEGRVSSQVTRTTFISHAFGRHTLIEDNCYNLQLKNKMRLYLMFISRSDFAPGMLSVTKEMWMAPQNGSPQFLCSLETSEDIHIKIDVLYSTICSKTKYPMIRKDIRDVIDAYLENDWEDDITNA